MSRAPPWGRPMLAQPAKAKAKTMTISQCKDENRPFMPQRYDKKLNYQRQYLFFGDKFTVKELIVYYFKSKF